MKLPAKTPAVLVLLFAATVVAASWLLARQQETAVQAGVVERARAVLSFGEACRGYARETLSPVVRQHTDRLIFEANSATFVARGTFEALRKRMPEYPFREASLNPLNPANQADAEEETLIRRFQADPSLPEVTGFLGKGENEKFYVARPVAVKATCLECHHSPQTAPPEVVRRYGDRHGYGWKEGEVKSAVMVASGPDARPEHPSGPGQAKASGSEPIWDRAKLLASLGGNPQALKHVAELARGECPRLLRAIRHALTQGHAAAPARAAHSLKGTVGSLAAARVHGGAGAGGTQPGGGSRRGGRGFRGPGGENGTASGGLDHPGAGG
jgi:hypothetical protein